MPHEVTVTYSKSLLRKTTIKYIIRQLSWLYFAALVLLAFSFISSISHGSRSWFIGVIGAILGLGFVFPLFAFIAHTRRNNFILSKMPSHKGTFIFDDDGFFVESEAGSGSIKWPMVTEVRQMKDAWLLIQGRYMYTTLPIENIDKNVRSFILRKVKNAGGKVT